jgi:SlyX protein
LQRGYYSDLINTYTVLTFKMQYSFTRNRLPVTIQKKMTEMLMSPEHNNEHSNQQLLIEQLETKVAYLEHYVEELNDALVALQLDNKSAKDALKYLYQQVQSIGGSQGAQTSGSANEPPPHY